MKKWYIRMGTGNWGYVEADSKSDAKEKAKEQWPKEGEAEHAEKLDGKQLQAAKTRMGRIVKRIAVSMEDMMHPEQMEVMGDLLDALRTATGALEVYRDSLLESDLEGGIHGLEDAATDLRRAGMGTGSDKEVEKLAAGMLALAAQAEKLIKHPVRNPAVVRTMTYEVKRLLETARELSWEVK